MILFDDEGEGEVTRYHTAILLAALVGALMFWCVRNLVIDLFELGDELASLAESARSLGEVQGYDAGRRAGYLDAVDEANLAKAQAGEAGDHVSHQSE